MTELGVTVADQVSAQLVDCVPPEPEPVRVPLPEPPTEATPVAQAYTATIEQVGADPPPGVRA